MKTPVKNKISQSVKEVPPALIREMSLKAAAYSNVISLGIGEPDFDTPEAVIRASMEDALRGHTHYTPSRGDEELIDALIAYIKVEKDIELEPNQLMVTHGGMGALIAALRAILDPEDEVIVFEPHFPSYKAQITFSGGRICYVSTRFEDGFIPDPRRVEKAITPRTKAMILNSPNNPTGATVPSGVLDELASIAVERDLIVISDEVYDKLVFKGSHDSLYKRPGMEQRTIVINSFSKTFAMTGWRIGYCYGPNVLIDQVLKVATYFTSCPSSIGQRAALAALKMDREIFVDMANEFKERCGLVYDRLKAIPGIRVHPSSGSFYVFPSVDSLTRDTMNFALELLDKEQVVVIPGEAFGPSGKGCIRISCTVGSNLLLEAMNRLERFVRNYYSS